MRVGVSFKYPATAGAVAKSVTCGVRPYPINSRNEASEPKSFALPKTPVSKLHSPWEFVGVASPNTGPWPSAQALDDTHKQNTSESSGFMIPSGRAIKRTSAHEFV